MFIVIQEFKGSPLRIGNFFRKRFNTEIADDSATVQLDAASNRERPVTGLTQVSEPAVSPTFRSAGRAKSCGLRV